MVSTRSIKRYVLHPDIDRIPAAFWCALCRYKFALDARWRTLLQLVCSLPRHSARRALIRLALEWLCLSCRMCVRNETSKASPCILMHAQRDPACATTACRDSKIHDRRVMQVVSDPRLAAWPCERMWIATTDALTHRRHFSPLLTNAPCRCGQPFCRTHIRACAGPIKSERRTA